MDSLLLTFAIIIKYLTYFYLLAVFTGKYNLNWTGVGHVTCFKEV